MGKEWKSIEEIIEFARKLEGHNLKHLNKPYALSEIREHGGKGGFGQYVENIYFGLETNSFSGPDFYPIKLELKTAGLKGIKDNKLTPKERLPLSMISYDAIVKESFDESSFKFKNSAILILWYLYKENQAFSDREFELVDVWKCLEENYNQIKKDYELIQKKVADGLAHEISEGDTLYLGACTKGVDSSDTVSQPFCPIPAKRRAFCFKIQYMRYIYQKMVDRKSNRKPKNKGLVDFCKPGEALEEAVASKIREYIGKTTIDLCRKFNVNNYTKSTYSTLAKEMLGANHKKLNKVYREFAAADIQVKIVRLDKHGNNKESVSFPAMNFCEIAQQQWEDSALYETLTKKFVFIIFRAIPGKEKDYTVDSIRIWNMPEKDLDIAREVWLDTKEKIQKGDYNNFISVSADRIVHVRPHDTKAYFNAPTPQGYMEKKKCFWLNKKYILKEIVNKPVSYSF